MGIGNRKGLLLNWGWQEVEERRWGDGNMRDQDGRVGGRTERESNGRDIMIQEVVIGLGRNLVPGKLPGTRKDDPS